MCWWLILRPCLRCVMPSNLRLRSHVGFKLSMVRTMWPLSTSASVLLSTAIRMHFVSLPLLEVGFKLSAVYSAVFGSVVLSAVGVVFVVRETPTQSRCRE